MSYIKLPTLPNYSTPVLEQQLGAAQSQTGSRFNNVWYQFLNMQLNRVASILSTIPINVRTDAGAKMDGSDDTGAFQSAINAAITNGGGVVFIPNGTLSYKSISIPASAPPILVSGQSTGGTILKLLGGTPSGAGMLDISAPNFSVSDLTIDASGTTPKQLQYGKDFSTGLNVNDPMAASLTANTSIWVHACARFSCYRVLFRHSQGYSILLDAMNGVLDDPDIENCWVEDIRAATFGTNPASLIFGSWPGGFYMNGDGRTASSGVVRRPRFVNCGFQRVTGNGIWSHLYGLNRLHEGLIVTACGFEDMGLDSILVGGFTGGTVSDNVIRRNGYVSLMDGQIGTPRWLAGFAPTAIDSSGVVKGVNYSANSVTSPNGAVSDLDGHSLSSYAGNVGRVPFPDEPEYTEDQIAITGPNNNGSQSYGVNLGNSNQTPEGGTNVDIVSNTLVNLPGGSVRLYAARFCNVMANIINAPSPSVNPPVAMGPTGTGQYQRSYNNRIAHNHCSYSPAASAPFCLEDDTISPFLNTEVNYVYANSPIIGNGNGVEFQKSPNSGSTVYSTQVWPA